MVGESWWRASRIALPRTHRHEMSHFVGRMRDPLRHLRHGLQHGHLRYLIAAKISFKQRQIVLQWRLKLRLIAILIALKPCCRNSVQWR